MSTDITIAVVGRDRFSTTDSCLEELLKHTPGPQPVILVLGGAPKSLQRKLEKKYAPRVKMVFAPRFLNPAQARNCALKEVHTSLAVLMDNDVYVRPGWLDWLAACQEETHAAMVVPLVLESHDRIHTAGNDLYITYDKGRQYASKTLRFYGQRYAESSNLRRVPTDYGELHCQLVHVETALRLKVYDENIMEVGECDSGLTWRQARQSMWFEPRSVVRYDLPTRVLHPEDIRIFAWRWDMRTILKGYVYFRKKWDMDISESGNFREFLVMMNNKLGLLPRLFPCQASLWIDHTLTAWRKGIVRLFVYYWCYTKARLYGYGEWLKDKY